MRCEDLTDEQLLKPIRHPEDNTGNTDIHTVEGCIRLNNNYRWYYGLAQVHQPELIAEIGVRYGYSLFAMARGSKMNPTLVGFDNESYCPASMQHTFDKLELYFPQRVTLYALNTQKEQSLAQYCNQIAMFSVDGDHTQDGCRHDMELAWPTLRRGGVLVVDDIDYAGQDGRINLRPVVQQFCQEKAVDFLYLPTTRGLAVIVKP